MGLGVRLLVRTERIGGGERRADQLAHAVGGAGGAGRRHHQAQQVDEEGPLGRQRRAAAELGVARVDRVRRRHAEGEPAGLVAAFRRQGLADQRDQSGRGRTDVDHRAQGQPRLAALEAEGEAEAVHQHRLALTGQAVDQLEAVVPAVLPGERQGLAVGRAEEMRRTGLRRDARQRRRAADREQPESLGERHQRGLGGGAAAEAGHRGRNAFQGIAHQRREHRLAPTLGDLLQAAQAPGQRRLVFRGDPGQQAEAQPHDRMGVRRQRRQVAERVPREQAVRGREGEEGRRDAGGSGAEAVETAALDQKREPAGKAGGGKPRHQLREA